jgi:hypothetical protein
VREGARDRAGHLADFVPGWMYVLGVGVAGGMVLKNRAAKKSAGAEP